jgi:hypothetical protein
MHGKAMQADMEADIKTLVLLLCLIFYEISALLNSNSLPLDCDKGG